MYGIDLEVQEKNWNGEGLPSVGQMVSYFCSNVEVVAGNPDKNGYVIILRGGEYCYVRLALLKPIPNPKETAKQKAIDENQRLREQLDAWAEKYADLKIKSDANKWAHDNMKKQLASAKADGIREAMQYATSNHTKGVRAALRKYIELLEGKG